MEPWIQYYLSFALSGALLAWWSIFLPSMHLVALETEGSHPILKTKFLSGVVWFLLCVVLIPILIIPLINESTRINFILSLTQGFLQNG